MHWLTLSIVILFICCTMLSASMEGEGAFASTTLTTAISDVSVTAQVSSTTGFPGVSAPDSHRVFLIGEEEIMYGNRTSTSFTGLTRGYNSTTAAYHAATSSGGSPTMVMSQETSLLNTLMGFKVVTTSGVWGKMTSLIEFVGTWLKSIPKFLMWDYPFLDGSMFGIPFAMVKPFLWAISAAFVVVFFMYVKNLVNPVS